MERYSNDKLNNLLKGTIEDHECTKVAILEGGIEVFGQELRASDSTVTAFDPKSLQSSWFGKVAHNPNYDCYACRGIQSMDVLIVFHCGETKDRDRKGINFFLTHFFDADPVQ
jgi:hypothetical protein